MQEKTRWAIIVCCLVMVFFVGLPGWAAEKEPAVGQVMGNLKFPKAMSDEDAKYLGVKAGQEFTLQEVAAPYLLVESFNTA